MRIIARLVKTLEVCSLAVCLTACGLVGVSQPNGTTETQSIGTPAAIIDEKPLFVPQSAAVIEPINASSLIPSRKVSFQGMSGFAWLPDGKGAALAGQQGVMLVSITDNAANIQASTPQAVQTIPSTLPSLLSSAQKAAVVAWLSEGDTVNVMDVSDGAGDPVSIQSDGPVTGLVLTSSGEQAAYATFDGKVFTFDVRDKQKTQAWAAPAWLTTLSYSPDASQLAGADPGNFKLYFMDAKTGEILRSLEWPETATSGLQGVYLSPDWSTAAWVAQGVVQLMDASDGTPGPILLHQDAINAVAWSPDGRLLATASAEVASDRFEPVVLLWDANNGEFLNKLVQAVAVESLSFSPDGRQLAVLNTDGGLQTWSVSR